MLDGSTHFAPSRSELHAQTSSECIIHFGCAKRAEFALHIPSVMRRTELEHCHQSVGFGLERATLNEHLKYVSNRIASFEWECISMRPPCIYLPESITEFYPMQAKVRDLV